mgnify:CR=1 FL=1
MIEEISSHDQRNPPAKNRIEVWCNDNELARIKANAENTRLSNSEFLRSLGNGYEQSAFDREAIGKACKTACWSGPVGWIAKTLVVWKERWGRACQRRTLPPAQDWKLANGYCKTGNGTVQLSVIIKVIKRKTSERSGFDRLGRYILNAKHNNPILFMHTAEYVMDVRGDGEK